MLSIATGVIIRTAKFQSLVGGGRESFLAAYSFFSLSAVVFGIEIDGEGDLPVVCGREGCHWHSEARGRDFGDIEVVAPQKADGNLGGGTMSAAARVRYIYIYTYIAVKGCCCYLRRN